MHIITPSVAQSLFLDNSPFRDASNEEKEFIIKLTRYREFKTKSMIFEAGAPSPGFWNVIEGRVRLSTFANGGEQHIIRDFNHGEWLGFISCLSDSNSPHDAIAVQDTKMLYLDKVSINIIYENYPHLYKHTVKLISSAFVRLAEHYNATSMPLISRIAAILCRLYNLNNKEAIKLSHAELAAHIGASREAVSSGLKKLENDNGILLKYRQIELNDWSILERISLGDTLQKK